jgi:hypothetical protein
MASRSENGPIRWSWGRDYRKRTSRNKRKKIDNDSNDRDSDNKTMWLNRAVATG